MTANTARKQTLLARYTALERIIIDAIVTGQEAQVMNHLSERSACRRTLVDVHGMYEADFVGDEQRLNAAVKVAWDAHEAEKRERIQS